jgi:hypothetical protein
MEIEQVMADSQYGSFEKMNRRFLPGTLLDDNRRITGR